MRALSSENGLLSIFRMFTALRLLLSSLGLISYLLLPLPRFHRLAEAPWLSVAETALVLAYLSWPWLRKRLDRAYIPIGLAIATLGPILVSAVTATRAPASEMEQVSRMLEQWQLLVTLFMPLILVAWRYRFRIVALYTLSLTAFDLALVAPFVLRSDGRLWPVISVVVFRTFLFLLFGYAISRLAFEQRQQNARLTEANRYLASHAAALEQLAVSRERNRLARELHDTLAHTLSAVAVQLEAVHSLWETSPAPAQAMLEQSLAMTRSGLGETRRAIQSLRAAPLEDLGLRLALESLAKAECERAGLRLILRLPETLPPLEADVEHGLYRIAEEALRNAARHARAAQVTVSLSAGGGAVTLCVQDDGQGLANDPQAANESFGLRGMQERAEALGGQLLLESQPGEGTKVTARMDSREPSDAPAGGPERNGT